MIALATSDEESTSPMPVMPASVWTRTTSVSWLPSQRSLTVGRRRWIGSTRVIFMQEVYESQQRCGRQFGRNRLYKTRPLEQDMSVVPLPTLSGEGFFIQSNGVSGYDQ